MRWLWVLGVLATAALGGDPSKGAKKPKPFEWRQFYGNAAHDNFRPRPDQIRWPKVLWHVPGAAGQPTIANGLVYSGGEALYVIDAKSGNVISERRRPDVRYLAAPVLAGHRVISRRSDGVLECHNARLRKLIWRNETALAGARMWVRGALLVNDLYIATGGVKVFAFGVKDGKLRWTQSATGGGVSMVPASDGTRVFFGTNAGDVLALDAGTGKVMWKVTEPGTNFRSSSPVVIDGRVGEIGRAHD